MCGTAVGHSSFAPLRAGVMQWLTSPGTLAVEAIDETCTWFGRTRLQMNLVSCLVLEPTYALLTWFGTSMPSLGSARRRAIRLVFKRHFDLQARGFS
jgi:hypothetical protein